MVYVSEDYSGCWVKARLLGSLAASAPNGSCRSKKQEAYSPGEPKWNQPVLSSPEAHRSFQAFSWTPSLVFDPRLPASSSPAFVQLRGQKIL